MPTYAYWSLNNETATNFGDALNLPLLRKMGLANPRHTGKPLSPRNPFKPIIIGIGSILESAKFIERPDGRNVYVWGTGTKGKLKNAYHLRRAKFCCVRGPLTRNVLLNHGIKNVPEVYGDPALLVPLLWNSKKQVSEEKSLIIPHYKDLEIAKYIINKDNKNVYNWEILNISDSIEEVITKISKSTSVLSSSLHGLIMADAFGIPNAWLNFGDNIGGGSFKYNDHHLAFWGKERHMSSIKELRDIENAKQNLEQPPPFDPKSILKSFPNNLYD